MLQALPLETLKIRVPSIFTTEGAAHTSEKYKHISTIEVVNGLMKEGFMPVKATQSRTRIADKKAYTKHMLRFRHVDSKPTVGGLFPEIVLVNSHDGLSSYKLMAGIFRLVCSNGLVAGNTFRQVRVKHQGDVIGNVIEGTYEIVSEANRALEHTDKMGAVILSPEEKLIFAESVHQIRFDGDESLAKQAIIPAKFLQPRRYQEQGKHDLFSVMNIVQENVIRGGLRGIAKDSQGYRKQVVTREIKSIDQNNALNRAIWTLAEKMMALKAS